MCRRTRARRPSCDEPDAPDRQRPGAVGPRAAPGVPRVRKPVVAARHSPHRADGSYSAVLAYRLRQAPGRRGDYRSLAEVAPSLGMSPAPVGDPRWYEGYDVVTAAEASCALGRLRVGGAVAPVPPSVRQRRQAGDLSAGARSERVRMPARGCRHRPAISSHLMTDDLRAQLAEYDRAVALAIETYQGMSSDERTVRAVAGQLRVELERRSQPWATAPGPCHGGMASSVSLRLRNAAPSSSRDGVANARRSARGRWGPVAKASAVDTRIPCSASTAAA